MWLWQMDAFYRSVEATADQTNHPSGVRWIMLRIYIRIRPQHSKVEYH